MTTANPPETTRECPECTQLDGRMRAGSCGTCNRSGRVPIEAMSAGSAPVGASPPFDGVEPAGTIEAKLAIVDDVSLALVLVRHALIEYAAQRHPYRELLDIASMLSDLLQKLPEWGPALEHARRVQEQWEGDPFRSRRALDMVFGRIPK